MLDYQLLNVTFEPPNWSYFHPFTYLKINLIFVYTKFNINIHVKVMVLRFNSLQFLWSWGLKFFYFWPLLWFFLYKRTFITSFNILHRFLELLKMWVWIQIFQFKSPLIIIWTHYYKFKNLEIGFIRRKIIFCDWCLQLDFNYKWHIW